MARIISYAHSRSILDRQRHVISTGSENQLLFHYDITADDAIKRDDNETFVLSPDRWEFISGSPSNMIVNDDGSAQIEGVTGAFTIVSKDYIEIDTSKRYTLSINALNLYDTTPFNRLNVGTINYSDINTKITAGRPSGVDYDNWVVYDTAIGWAGGSVALWNTYTNVGYKTTESAIQADLDKWPIGTRYARIFVRIENLNTSIRLMIKNILMVFADGADNFYSLTPEPYLLDANDGKFGGAVELAGPTARNLVWNGNLIYGATEWSVGVTGAGAVTGTLDSDGSYKVYFENVRDVRNIIQVDMPQEINSSTEYTLSFYARAAVAMGFRRTSVIHPGTEVEGWAADDIIYIGNTWQKFSVTESSGVVASGITRVVLTEPDMLEPESLFIYHNGALIRQTIDYVERNDNQVQFNFDTAPADTIDIFSKNTTPGTLDYERSDITPVAIPGQTVFSVPGGDYTGSELKVYRNGLLLIETDDYTTNPGAGTIQLVVPAIVGDLITIFKSAAPGGIDPWVGQSAAAADQWTSVAYGNGVFVAVSYDGTVMTSPDGAAWTIQPGAVAGTWRDVAFGNGVFVAVADGGSPRSMYSSNGITWTGVSIWSAAWHGITFGGGRFVAVAVSGFFKTGTSTDGIDWTYDSAISNSWRAVTYGAELFVAVASTGVGNRVMTSPDGTDWTSQSSAANNYWRGVIYGNGMFVAVSQDGTNKVMYSYNGADWFSASSVNNVWTDVAYGNGKFIAVTPSGTNQTMWSLDGISWTPQAAANLAGWNAITYGNGMFVAVAWDGSGDRVMTQSAADVMKYVREDYILDASVANYNTSQTFGVSDDSLQVHINGVLQRVGPDYLELDANTVTLLASFNTGDTLTTLILASSLGDAHSYEQATYYGTDVGAENILDTPAINLNYVEDTSNIIWVKNVSFTEGKPYRDVYHPGQVATTDLKYITDINERESTLTFNIKPYAMDLEDIMPFAGEAFDYTALPSGSDWAIGNSGISGNWSGLVYANGLFVAVRTGSPLSVATTIDGVTWNFYAGAGNQNWNDVTYGNGLFVAVSSSGTGNRVMTSSDGASWSYQSSTADNGWVAVAYGNGKFVAIAYDGVAQVMTSTNGTLWLPEFCPAQQWASITFGKGLFVAVANSGSNRSIYSSDGVTWTSGTGVAENAWRSVTFGNGLFVAVADSGAGNRVMTSTDGMNWAMGTGLADNWWYDVVYGHGEFIAVSYGGPSNRIASSTDGINWGGDTVPVTSAWKDVAYGDGIFVALSNGYAIVKEAAIGSIYRTINDYKYWKWDGSSYDEVAGPAVLYPNYNSSWSLFKVERIFGETSKFQVVVGYPGSYNTITLPELPTDEWTMITIGWSLLGEQWYQVEYDTLGAFPTLTVNETGYVYRAADTGNYYIWDGASWAAKAPSGTYSRYIDLPTLTAFEDGYSAYVDVEPELYQGTVPDYGSLPVGYDYGQHGWVYKTVTPTQYYMWDWDYVEETGAWHKIIPGYYYQWNWDKATSTGAWEQSNKIKIYVNGGTAGIYTKSYYGVPNAPDEIIIGDHLYGKIDEMRLDRVTRDAEEVMVWYNSQTPFYPPEQATRVL